MGKLFFTFTTEEDGNLAYYVSKNKTSVEKNIKALAKKHDFDIKKLRYMNQVHKDSIKIVTNKSENLQDSCDALITNERNLPLMVLVADCIPILLHDEKKDVIAAIHAGRNSTFLNITKKTVQKMIQEFKCEAKDIKAYLGPSIQKCCYEVSDELVKIVEKSFSEEFTNGRFIDLQGINIMQLKSLGVYKIDKSDICTKCGNMNYFSYRKNQNCGRFAGLIFLK